MTAIVEVNQLSKHYRLGKTTVHALKDVNLRILPGETVILSGPSGSGKSTLLHLIGCLDRPSSGSVVIKGLNSACVSDNRLSQFRAEHLGFVFQTFNLVPVMTVFENVEYPLLLNKSRRNKQRVMAMLENVGLAGHARQYPNELSGGQRQRVAIARALVHDPQLLIADEPTANLDSKTGDTVLDLMFDLARSHNAGVILSSHDPRVIAQSDKRQVTLFDGQIIGDVTTTKPQAVAG